MSKRFVPSFLDSLESRRLLSVSGVAQASDEASLTLNARTIQWQGESTEVFAGRWIVRLDGVVGDRSTQSRLADQRSQRVHQQLRSAMPLTRDGAFLMNTPLSWTVDRTLRELRKVEGFRAAEPDRVVYNTAVPNDPSFPSLWGMNNAGDTDINAPQAWDITTGSGDVVIGVLDSGVQWNHPDLIDNIYVNPGEIEGNGIDDDGNGFIDDVRGWDFLVNDNDPTDLTGHGTA
jgi:hypothetical protein